MPFGSTLTYEQDAKASRKARGAFFTPAKLANELVNAVIETQDARVFEPSCGEACFLRESWHRLVDLGANPVQAGEQLFGCELHVASADAARRRLREMGATASIAVSDFFDLEATEAFDVIVGNPPYVRYQDFCGEAREKALRKSSQAGVELSSLCSSWAPFLATCVSMLKRGGNIGMVLPAELLTVGYAAPLRRFLLASFDSLEVTMFDERVFPEVQEEVVLLVARQKGGVCNGRIGLRRIRGLSDWRVVHEGVVHVKPDGSRWSELLGAGPASSALALDDFCVLGDWGRVSLGAVTGANGYFAMSRAQANSLGLRETECARIVPPGSSHLRLLVYGSRQEAECERAGMSTRLFRPDATELSGDALTYIAQGELQGVDGRYKCRIRNPWWRVPLPSRPADLFFTYMNDVSPQLCDNQCGAYHLNSVHGIYLRDDVRTLGKDLLPIACLNSLTSLSAELEGRQYGGGLLKMEPREAASLKVPSPQLVDKVAGKLRAARTDVLVALSKGGFRHASEIVDRIVLVEGVGMADEVGAINGAACALASRRHMRAKSVGCVE